MNPYYYGLVKQIGPWKTTARDLKNGQSYDYTPNNQIDTPYTVSAGNGSVYAQYSSQGLIYDATTSPEYVSRKSGKVKRGKVVREKTVALVGADGEPIVNPQTYAMQQFMKYQSTEIISKNKAIAIRGMGTTEDGDVLRVSTSSKSVIPVPGLAPSPSSPLHEVKEDNSPTSMALSQMVQGLQVDPEAMLTQEEIVSRIPDAEMNSVGPIDEPYGDVDEFEQLETQKKIDSLRASGYKDETIKKMLKL